MHYRIRSENDKNIDARCIPVTKGQWHLFRLPFVYSSSASVCIHTEETDISYQNYLVSNDDPEHIGAQEVMI